MLKLNMFPKSVLLVCSFCAGLGNVSAGTFTLVREGRPDAAIIVAKEPARAAQLAALEIQHSVKQITGAALPILHGEKPATGIALLVGESEGTRALGLRNANFLNQEYLIRFTGRNIILMGRDAADTSEVAYDPANLAGCKGLPGFWEEQGTLYAAYDFLERFCGVRWLNPTDFGTVIPKMATLKVRAREIRRSPGFEFRDAIGATGNNPARYDGYVSLWPSGSEAFRAWDASAYAKLHARYPQQGKYDAARKNRAHLFLLRRRNGGRINRCNHSLYGFYNRFWEKSRKSERAKLFVRNAPDMFAKGYQGKPPQMCYTSRELIQQLAQDARDYYDGKKTGAELGIFWQPELPNMFPVEPMDNSSYCKGDRCRAWLPDEKETGSRVYSTSRHSNYFFNFVNEVQKELGKTHPDKSIITLAYSSHAAPPSKFQLDPRVAVQFCFASNRSPARRANYDNEIKLLKQWAEDGSGRPLYLWLYYTFPVETARNGKYHCFPGFFAHTVGKQMKLFKKLGYRGMFHCGYGQEVEAYVSFRMMDDPTGKVARLLDEYFDGLYGAAAVPMKKLYAAMEKVYCDPRNYPEQRVSSAELSWGRLGTAARMKRFQQYLDLAKLQAKSERSKTNLRLFELGVWSYMTAGRNKYAARKRAPVPSLKAPRVPVAGGDVRRVAWDKAAPLNEPWYDRGGAEPSARKFSGRVAHDGEYLYLELSDPCDTEKLVSSAMVFPYDDWEVFVAAQRAVPYRQYAVGPTGLIKALAHGEVNFRMNVPIDDHGVKAASDTSVPDRWVVRMAIPLKGAIPGGVSPGGRVYMNIIRVTSPSIAHQPRLGIDTWVSYCTVHEVDRLAEVLLVE